MHRSLKLVYHNAQLFQINFMLMAVLGKILHESIQNANTNT